MPYAKNHFLGSLAKTLEGTGLLMDRSMSAYCCASDGGRVAGTRLGFRRRFLSIFMMDWVWRQRLTMFVFVVEMSETNRNVEYVQHIRQVDGIPSRLDLHAYIAL